MTRFPIIPTVLALVGALSAVPNCHAQAPDPSASPQQQEKDAAQAASSATAPAATPVPAGEMWLTGSIDLGYRWLTGVDGSFNTYRSIVDLGEGPKLIGTEFTITDPKRRAFDQVNVRAYGFGGDPYETFHLDAKKSKLYNFSADYRDIAYFNYLPSYADPLLANGIVLNEQSFDTHRHFANFQLDLLPGNWFTPYFAFDRDSGSGTGASVFVTDANSFPVPSTLSDLTNLYRGGVRLEFRHFHVTLEEGGTTFKDDESLFQTPTSTNFGNILTPVFGETTDLTGLLTATGVRGTSTYTKGLLSASVLPWLDFYGQFLYSEPNTSVNYSQADTGNLLLESQLLFYTGEQFLLSSSAKLPHTSASFGAEMRPFHRLRLVESWMTDRLHNAGSALSNQTLTGFGASEQTAALLASTLATNYNQAQIEAFFDVTPKLVIHGGYRYVWGEADDAVLPPAGLVSSDQATLRRHVGLGGVTFRPFQKLSISGDVEGASSGRSYFRTSLYDYQKVRALARYHLLTTLDLSADFTFLNNQNPTPGVNYNYRAEQESLSLFWAPDGGKVFDLQGSYARSALYSNLGYLDPGTLSPLTSLYRDNAHTATALFSLKLPRASGFAPKVTAGGSFFTSSGSRPTSYYQPLATLWAPINKHVSWFTQWQYYGYGEAFYLYEAFHTHVVTTGLRFTR